PCHHTTHAAARGHGPGGFLPVQSASPRSMYSLISVRTHITERLPFDFAMGVSQQDHCKQMRKGDQGTEGTRTSFPGEPEFPAFTWRWPALKPRVTSSTSCLG